MTDNEHAGNKTLKLEKLLSDLEAANTRLLIPLQTIQTACSWYPGMEK